MARDVSLIEVKNHGIVCPPSQSRQPLCIVSRKLDSIETVFFRFDCKFLTLLHTSFRYRK